MNDCSAEILVNEKTTIFSEPYTKLNFVIFQSDTLQCTICAILLDFIGVNIKQIKFDCTNKHFSLGLWGGLFNGVLLRMNWWFKVQQTLFLMCIYTTRLTSLITFFKRLMMICAYQVKIYFQKHETSTVIGRLLVGRVSC